MNAKTALFNEFDRKFRELKRRSADPSQIELLVKNSPDVRRLVGALYFWERDFESKRSEHRFLGDVPSWFIERYKLYKERFAPEVDRVYGGLWLDAMFFEDALDGIPPEEILHPEGPPPPKDGDDGDKDEIAGWFTPGSGEGAEAVDSIIWWLWNMHEGYDSAEDLRTGLDAWEWFTETVGIDLPGIEERWGKLPRALIPTHVTRPAGTATRDGLVELLDDATKAYVFGLPAAAVAMCRAVCERVLKEFYFGDDKKEEKLGKLAFLAEKKYEWIKQKKLGKHIESANKVMHNYQGGRPSEDQLDVVRQFLETTKTLIEIAPKKAER